MSLVPDRRREQEAYDLARAGRTLGILVDCPVSRLVAMGLAAAGAQTLLLGWPDPEPRRRDYLVPEGAASRTESGAMAFIRDTLQALFCDAGAAYARAERDIGSSLLQRGSGVVPLLVVPAFHASAVAAVYDLAERGGPEWARHLRVVAAGPRGCCLVRPDPAEAEDQLRALRAVMEGDPGADPLSIDAALIAAGTLLHEARLLTGTRLARATDDECEPRAICSLSMPDPVDAPPCERLVVGAGGLGAILALLGIAPTARPGDRMTLVDGDRVERHNLLLHNWAGSPKVEALRAEIERRSGTLAVDVVAEMVTPDTVLPPADITYAVTDSAPSRRAVQEAMPGNGPPSLICAGASTGGAEAFIAGGGPACVACRYPGVDEAQAATACSRNPASFASNMLAAGLALALGRRMGTGDFIDSDDGASRHAFSTSRPDRLARLLPQRCAHFSRSVAAR
ncbi:MAG: ThiF family adenylyltransferase [Armatimonadota bacterium]